MPTQYEILLQEQLERSRRPSPLEEYGAGLVGLAQQQAYQGFLQQQAAQHLAGQKEILTQQQKLAAELEKQREEAAYQRTELSTASAEKRAQIAADAAQKARTMAETQQEQQRLIREFQELGVERKKGESDEDYIVRAQGEARTVRGQHLAALHNQSQAYVAQINDIAAKAAASYPQRLSDYAWARTVAQESDPARQAALKAVKDPAAREAALAKLGTSKAAVALRGTYQLELDKAQTAVGPLEPTQQIEIERLRNMAGAAARSFETLIQNPRYAPAIPEFNRLIGQPAPGAGGGIDFSRIAPPGTGSARQPGGLPVGVAAPAVAPEIGPRLPPTPLAPPVPRPAAAAAAPGVVAPPSAAEVYGGTGPDYGWAPGQRTPLIGAFSEPVTKAGAAISNWNPLPAVTVPLDIGGAIANQWLGTPQFSLTERARAAGAFDQLQENPQLVQAQLRGMGLPGTLPESVPAPTPAEIAAYATLRRGPLRAPAVYGSMPLPSPAPAAPEIAPPPQATLGRLDLEQRLLQDYARRTAPVFDPTMLNVQSRAAIEAGRGPGPSRPALPAPTPAYEVMGADALRATRLREAMRLKYPKATQLLNLDVIPYEKLKDLYDRLELEQQPFPTTFAPRIAAPSPGYSRLPSPDTGPWPSEIFSR